MVTCNMCIPVKVKNVPPKSGTADQGFPEGVILSAMSRVHSWAWSTVKAAPKNMVASSQLRTQGLSPRLAAITASTIVRDLLNSLSDDHQKNHNINPQQCHEVPIPRRNIHHDALRFNGLVKHPGCRGRIHQRDHSASEVNRVRGK